MLSLGGRCTSSERQATDIMISTGKERPYITFNSLTPSMRPHGKSCVTPFVDLTNYLKTHTFICFRRAHKAQHTLFSERSRHSNFLIDKLLIFLSGFFFCVRLITISYALISLFRLPFNFFYLSLQILLSPVTAAHPFYGTLPSPYSSFCFFLTTADHHHQP